MGQRVVWASFALAMAVGACGEESAPTPPSPGSSSGGDGGRATTSGGTRSDAGTETDAGGDPLGPVVELVDPDAARALDPERVLVGSRVDIRCRATPNPTTGEAVDPGSVWVQVASLTDESASAVEAEAAPEGGDVFHAVLSIESLPHGAIEVSCGAADRTSEAREGRTAGRVYYDRGPEITVIRPTPEEAFAGADEVVAEVTLEGLPLFDGDDRAEDVSAQFFINGVEVTDVTAPPGNGEGSYTFTIDFDDTAYFTEGLVNASLEVVAQNGREPIAALREVQVPLIVDDLGPTVDIVSPSDREIRGGEVTVRVRVSDAAAGVDPANVWIEVANGDPVTMQHNGGRDYSHTFATRQFDPAPSITLEVTAEDDAGNRTTQDILLYLDNVAPWISMDPPTMRARKANGVCSPEFDPVGGVLLGSRGEGDAATFETIVPHDWPAANDGDTVYENVMLRAFIFDRTNTAPGVSSVQYSGIVDDEGTVELWVQRDPSVPLLIDTNGDGYCDDIHTSPDQDLSDPSAYNLDPLGPTGQSSMPTNELQDFATDPVLEESGLGAPTTAGCNVEEGSTTRTPETGDCNATPMFVLKHDLMVGSPQPVVYAFNPNPPNNEVDCRGATVPLQLNDPNFSDWVCVAVRAYDEAGNRGVSAPLRLCVDNKNVGSFCESTAPPPSCLGSCVLRPQGSVLNDGGPKDIPPGVPRIVRY